MGELSKEIPGSIMAFFLLYFFTNIAGLSPTLAGAVLLVGRLWDGINDPMIGWLSDRTHSRWGRRFPWILWGAIPLGISFALIWLTPPLSSEWARFFYYSGVSILLFTAHTAIAIPHSTLGAELTQTYSERIELTSFKSSFSIGSSILGILIAQVIFSLGLGAQQKYAILGLILGTIVTVAAFLCVWGTYHRYWQMQQIRPAVQSVANVSIIEQLRIVLSLRPFLAVMGIYLCSWVGLQTTAAILQYYVIDYMGLPEQHFTQMVLAVQGTAILMIFFWNKVGQRLGKRAIYLWGIPFTLAAQLGLFWLNPTQILEMYALGILAGFGLATAYLVPWSMLPDVIDLDELQTGQRREGIFCGVFVLLQKLGTALAIFIVGQILSRSGYLARSANETLVVPQPESALVAIRWLLGPAPAVVLMAGIAIATLYPITRHRHQDILLQLQEKRRSP